MVKDGYCFITCICGVIMHKGNAGRIRENSEKRVKHEA